MLALVNTPSGEAPVGMREVPEPSPAPQEAVVGVRAFSLNRGDLYLLPRRPDGWVPGVDVAGVVSRAAADGTGPPQGSRVVGFVGGSGWAQRTAVRTDSLAVLPEKVGFAQAATLPGAGLTALRAVQLGASLLGRRVLVTGASGGVGRFAVQLAALSGASVTGVVGSPERGGGLLDLGASDVVAGVGDAEGRFELILESAGGTSFEAAMGKLVPGGTLVCLGNSSMRKAAYDFYDYLDLLPSGARIEVIFTVPGTAEIWEKLGLLTRLVEAGTLVPQVGYQGIWEDIARGIEELRERRVAGKAIFRID